IEAIFSAADIGFKGSLLTSPAAYMGTITGCFLLPEHKSFLLLWEPPHWYLSPYASWISCSSVHTSIIFAKVSSVELISSLISRTGMEGKQTSNIRSRRLSNVVYIKEKIFLSSFVNCFKSNPKL
uniref:Uncharacterized protein n=1 Tax=Strix occidentalis caurina TaxID=311401 RepID=A0A8D0FVV8_STROC